MLDDSLPLGETCDSMILGRTSLSDVKENERTFLLLVICFALWTCQYVLFV